MSHGPSKYKLSEKVLFLRIRLLLTLVLPVAQKQFNEFKVDLRWMIAICFNFKFCFYATGKCRDKPNNIKVEKFPFKVTCLV